MSVKTRGFDVAADKFRRAARSALPMAEVALYLQQENIARFSEQETPSGQSWKPSKRAQRDSGQTLVDTGRLRQSVLPDWDNASARVGTGLVYAITHQDGWPARNIPQREFLGIAPDELDNVIDILEAHFGNILN